MSAALKAKFIRFVIVLELVWLVVIFAIAYNNISHQFDNAEHFAIAAVEESLHKDLAYRKWNAGHGGVYVPITETTLPNEYLKVSNRELYTSEGITLTKINPAYMTRQVHELSKKEFGSKGHITSLNPIRPANRADKWEASALRRIEKNRVPVHEVVTENNITYMRAMIPLVAEETCLTCHASQGYKLNDIRGGLSASIPMTKYLEVAYDNSATTALTFCLIWIIGGAGILWAGRSLRISIGKHLLVTEDLRKSEQRFSDLVNTTDGVVWEVDFKTFQFTFVSESAEKLFGYPRTQWYEKDFWAANIHPDDRENTIKLCLSNSQNLQDYEFEYRFKKKSGEYLWIRDLVTVIAENGQPSIMRGILLDISVHKEQMLALQQYEAVVETSDKFIAVVDEEYRYVLVNNTFLKYHNTTKEDVIGKTAREVLGENAFKKLIPHLEQCMAGNEQKFELEIDYPNHGKRTKEVIYRPVYSNGKVTRIAAMISDITEKKEVEVNIINALHQAEEANKAKAVFLANMSHEIRTPLNGVMGMLQLLKDTSLDAEQAEFVRTATTSGWDLLELLNDILDLSKIDAGKVDIVIKPFSLTDLIKKLDTPFAALIKSKGLSYRYNIGPNVPKIVTGDAKRIRQILQNIMGNAVKFTQEGGLHIDVFLRDNVDDQKAIIEFMISDSGIGIPENLRKCLFDPFVQGDSSYSKEYQGAGLGLDISRRLIEVLGGTIDLQSSVGVGSTFTIRIPFDLTKRQEESRPFSQPVASEKRQLKILIAEDNKVNQIMLQRMLKKEGHQVIAVENGSAAIESINGCRPDIILMDIQMPVMDGIEATKIIREDEKKKGEEQLPIVALTAYVMVGDREKFLSAGMTAYLPKPVAKKDLFRLLYELTNN